MTFYVGLITKLESEMKSKKVPANLQIWIDAKKQFRLSNAQIQMARELGMNPENFGKLNNHRQEKWKLPLPLLIEELYFKNFGKDVPDRVVPIEDKAKGIKRQTANPDAGRLHNQ